MNLEAILHFTPLILVGIGFAYWFGSSEWEKRKKRKIKEEKEWSDYLDKLFIEAMGKNNLHRH